jgi:hypothetical protein
MRWPGGAGKTRWHNAAALDFAALDLFLRPV